MKSNRVVTERVKYVHEHACGRNTMYIKQTKEGVLIQTTDDSNNTQHDFDIDNKDWKLIKMIIDNFVDSDYEEAKVAN
ncbi:hypothetical protein MX629_11320 [Carnobacterium divergens]|uniref:DUF2693 domain-containing protein n=1 Tax=Carnobacterium divergens TaxID=2748 RepID=A0AAW8RCF7_CARDV|nr:hypothetical protein [Carnobacterium divergens]MDT1959019.1 hypothetical protein [Carnobacterium divergens]MDT1975128.1 hypothetical protein [Carnobacterium divergens]